VMSLLRLGSVVIRISELLNMKFIGRRNIQTPISRAIVEVIEYHKAGRYIERNYAIARLEMLAKHLEEIKKHDENLLKKFKNKIKREESYHGFRFEVAITASLIRKNIKFEKTEAPDFTIHYQGQELYIEATTVRLSKPKKKAIENKIINAIRRKYRKEYCNQRTALFIDITNLLHHNIIYGKILQYKDIKDIVKKALSKRGFGSILMFAYVCNLDLKRYEFNYIRVDNDAIDPLLEKFLDQYYPIKGIIIYNYHVFEKAH